MNVQISPKALQKKTEIKEDKLIRLFNEALKLLTHI